MDLATVDAKHRRRRHHNSIRRWRQFCHFCLGVWKGELAMLLLVANLPFLRAEGHLALSGVITGLCCYSRREHNHGGCIVVTGAIGLNGKTGTANGDLVSGGHHLVVIFSS